MDLCDHDHDADEDDDEDEDEQEATGWWWWGIELIHHEEISNVLERHYPMTLRLQPWPVDGAVRPERVKQKSI